MVILILVATELNVDEYSDYNGCMNSSETASSEILLNQTFMSIERKKEHCVDLPQMPGEVAWSEACPLGMQAAPSSIPTSGTFFRRDLVMKTFLRPVSLYRWFKKSSCQLPAKECALITGKLPMRLAQEQCG